MKATEKKKEYMKQYNKIHKEKIKIAQKKYYENHKEYFKQFNRSNYKELQHRIDKAIEYIENTPLYTETYDYNMEDNLELNYVSDEKAHNDLLNILRGEDND